MYELHGVPVDFENDEGRMKWTSSRMATDTIPEIIESVGLDEESLYRILIHNDDVTPFDFVIIILRSIFKLSPELAEHVTLTAHMRGLAIVMVRPRAEAEHLVAKAHMAARLEGFPLTFTFEPDA